MSEELGPLVFTELVMMFIKQFFELLKLIFASIMARFSLQLQSIFD